MNENFNHLMCNLSLSACSGDSIITGAALIMYIVFRMYTFVFSRIIYSLTFNSSFIQIGIQNKPTCAVVSIILYYFIQDRTELAAFVHDCCKACKE